MLTKQREGLNCQDISGCLARLESMLGELKEGELDAIAEEEDGVESEEMAAAQEWLSQARNHGKGLFLFEEGLEANEEEVSRQEERQKVLNLGLYSMNGGFWVQ